MYLILASSFYLILYINTGYFDIIDEIVIFTQIQNRRICNYERDTEL